MQFILGEYMHADNDDELDYRKPSMCLSVGRLRGPEVSTRVYEEKLVSNRLYCTSTCTVQFDMTIIYSLLFACWSTSTESEVIQTTEQTTVTSLSTSTQSESGMIQGRCH